MMPASPQPKIPPRRAPPLSDSPIRLPKIPNTFSWRSWTHLRGSPRVSSALGKITHYQTNPPNQSPCPTPNPISHPPPLPKTEQKTKPKQTHAPPRCIKMHQDLQQNPRGQKTRNFTLALLNRDRQRRLPRHVVISPLQQTNPSITPRPNQRSGLRRIGAAKASRRSPFSVLPSRVGECSGQVDSLQLQTSAILDSGAPVASHFCKTL